MTTPQDPPVRRKQKARRTKKLALWRAKKAAGAATGAATAAAAPKKTAAKKTAAKKTAAK